MPGPNKHPSTPRRSRGDWLLLWLPVVYCTRGAGKHFHSIDGVHINGQGVLLTFELTVCFDC
jgi:hypothetical protein